MAKFQFEHLSVLASKLNKMPVNYREYKTFYTTHEFLSEIYHNIGINETIEWSIRDLKDSCLGAEFGFKKLATFTNKLTGESIAIFGI